MKSAKTKEDDGTETKWRKSTYKNDWHYLSLDGVILPVVFRPSDDSHGPWRYRIQLEGCYLEPKERFETIREAKAAALTKARALLYETLKSLDKPIDLG